MLHIPPTKHSSPNSYNKQIKNKNKRRAKQKSIPFRKRRFGEKEVRKMGQTEKDKTGRATGLGRRTREDIFFLSGIKLTALRRQTGGGETSEIPGLPSGVKKKKKKKKKGGVSLLIAP